MVAAAPAKATLAAAATRALMGDRMRRTWLMRFVGAFAILLGLLAIGVPLAARVEADGRMRSQARMMDARIGSWNDVRLREQLERAMRYNRSLEVSGAVMRAGAVDPFDGGDSAASVGDHVYRDALDMDGSGYIGSIALPSIDAELPIYHGTGMATLFRGVGHMYGTSLPIGDVGRSGVHAVLSAHTGLADATMFTRLDELRRGSEFSVVVAGRRLRYQVDRIEVVEPNRTDLFGPVPGEDRISLLTCIGLGNTKRLVVSGVRVTQSETDGLMDGGRDGASQGGIGVAARFGGVVALSLGGLAWLLLCAVMIMASGEEGRFLRSVGARHARVPPDGGSSLAGVDSSCGMGEEGVRKRSSS